MDAREHLKWLLELMDENGSPYNDRGRDQNGAAEVHTVFDYVRIPVKQLNEARQAAGLPPVDEEVTP